MIQIILTLNLIASILPGEKLTYEVKYGFIKAGVLTLSLTKDSLDGQPVYHILMRLHSSPSFSRLYSINDEFHSYVDTAFTHSIVYKKRIREGNYKLDVSISYFPDSGYALYSNGKRYVIEGNVFDPLAAIFFMRKLGVKPGETLRIPYHVDGITAIATVVPERFRKIRLPWGKYRGVSVKPDFGKKGLLKGETTLWIGPYKPYIPLFIEARISFGTLSAKLIRYQIRGKDVIPLRH